MTTLVNVLLIAVGVYALVGIVFVVPFVLTGVAHLDAAARGPTWGFRLIIVPGVVALWPMLAWRWVRRTPVIEHNAHRDGAVNRPRPLP